MNPFKVQRLWKVTYQYGLDGIRRELNLPSLVITAMGVFLLCVLVLAALFLLNVKGLNRTNDSLAKLKQENLQLRHKLDYYSSLVDSIYQRIDSSRDDNSKPATSDRLYPYYNNSKTSQISDNTFVYDSYLDARVNSIELLLRKITAHLNITTSAPTAYAADDGNSLPHTDNGPSIFPTFGRWSDGWGTRLHPFYHNLYFHYGVDIANKLGTPIYATADGVVTLTGYDSEYGKLIKIKHSDNYETRYGHLYSFQVAQGDQVRKGQVIALMGSTGMSTGPHLHYEVLVNGTKVNPTRYLNRIDDAVYYAKR